MTAWPCAATRATVLLALAQATRWKTGPTVSQERIIEFLPRDSFEGGPYLQSFTALVNEAQAEWYRDIVPNALLELALEGLADMNAHVSGAAAITGKGLVAAKPLRPPRNVTVSWFDRYLTPERYDELVRHLARKTRHSRDESEIREFVHEYIVNTGERDGLRDRIMAGDDPSPGSIRAWVWKQALSIFRNEGTDAQTRTLKNARTERDLRNETPDEAYQVAVDGPTAVVYEAPEGSEHEGGSYASANASSGAALLDVVDFAPRFDEVLEHQAALARGMARLEAAVRSYKPNAADRYARVLGHLASGMKPADVATAEKVSDARAATLIAEVRAAGRLRANLDRVRDSVLSYLKEEPMSTLTDLVGELGDAQGNVPLVVSELLSEGLIITRRGGSLEVTRLGSFA